MLKILKKMNLLLDNRQKRTMIVLIVMMLVGGVLESLGISMLVPIITVVLDPSAVEESTVLSALYDGLGMESSVQFAVFLLLAFVGMTVLKNVYLFFQQKLQLKFVYTNQFATSRRMMINFMKRPYEYYLNADTSVIQRNITSDVNNMYGLILSCLQLFSECIVFVCLVAALFLFSDAMMIMGMAVLMVLLLFVIKKVLKPIMIRAGQENQEFYSGLYKWIEQSVMGIKEIKIGCKENYFINEYAKCGAGYVNAVQKYNLFNATPRLLIETVCITGMVGYFVLTLGQGTQLTELLPQLTALVAAAMRLLPSVNRINNYQTSISYFEPFFMGVSDNLQEEIHDGKMTYDAEAYRKKQSVEKLPLKENIRLEDITYKYPNTEKLIFDHAGMEIPIGASVGIVGVTGSGKTTIVDVLLGLLQMESGRILADGVDVSGRYEAWLKNIGYIPQTIFMIDDSIRKNVAFGVPEEEIDEEKVWRALEEAALDDFVRSLPEGLETGIGERGIRISGGQRQRISIARALYEDPEVLVLDEATSALDNDTEAAIMDSINRLHGKKTLVIIAHRLQTIEKCDMVYRVAAGKISRER
ncbi:MAG: ABC transporter ATP-binding protein/permease [Lachnospiraceae bacterium]|nr:ABC transporter ATP-binding protein/permease [Lachnospiraceae bacterium]MDE7177713.1 ABC transporter ATP-binding protein/permease [Lachnospiraceae bacterium]